jgi:hypothetical protein
MLAETNPYKRISGVLKISEGIIYWDCFPGLNKLCLKKEGEIGRTYNFLIPFDASKSEIEQEIINFLQNGPKKYTNL